MRRPGFVAGSTRGSNFFLVYVLLIWAVTIAGFGLEMIVKNRLDRDTAWMTAMNARLSGSAKAES